MWISTETTYSRKAARPNDGWQLQKCIDMPSWFKTMLIKRYSQGGKRRPPWHLVQIFSPLRNLKCLYTQKNFLAIYKAFLEFAHILWEATKPTIFLKDKNPLQVFSKRRQFHQHYGLHVIMCCNITSKLHRVLVESILLLVFPPDWSSKSRRRCVWNSGKTSNQHLSKWPYLPRMSLMKNNFSSHKHIIMMIQKNKPLKEKNNLDKMQSNG